MICAGTVSLQTFGRQKRKGKEKKERKERKKIEKRKEEKRGGGYQANVSSVVVNRRDRTHQLLFH